MNSRGCLGVHWDPKIGTFDKLLQTSQKFQFITESEPIKNLWNAWPKKILSQNEFTLWLCLFPTAGFTKVFGNFSKNGVFMVFDKISKKLT